MTQLDDTDLLLSAALRSDIDVGEACVVDAQGRAFMFTGKNVFWCCIVWGFEYLPLGDGTIVEVINVESTDSTMVTVRVLDSPGKPELVNLIGTVQKSFLHRAVDHEAREGVYCGVCLLAFAVVHMLMERRFGLLVQRISLCLTSTLRIDTSNTTPTREQVCYLCSPIF